MKDNETSSCASSVSSDYSDDIGSDGIPLDGELAILALSLELRDDDYSSIETSSSEKRASQITESSYGHPLSVEEATKLMPPGGDGLVRHATVIPDDYFHQGKLMRGLNKRDFLDNGEIKSRRGSLPLTMTQLLSSLTKIDGPEGPRYIFSGVLNGWPSLCVFELIALEKKRTLGPLTAPDSMHSSRLTWSHYWSAHKEGKEGISPAIKDKSRIYQAKLRSPPWSSSGWSLESPGFAFWYESQHPEGPRLTYGSNVVKTVGDDKCTALHMLSHRYAVAKESAKDKVTYHSFVLLEWEHGKYCTVVEAAYMNGMGGYNGKCNWFHDRDEKGGTALYKSLPPELVCPWLTTVAEVRCYDVEAKSLDEMKEYMKIYSGADTNCVARFIDPKCTFSHSARLTYRSRSNIAQYLLNYISRDYSYSELKRNCQTFAADLCSFVAGKKDVAPYHPINRMDYHNRTHLFLYDSSMYDKKKKGSKANQAK